MVEGKSQLSYSLKIYGSGSGPISITTSRPHLSCYYGTYGRIWLSKLKSRPAWSSL